LVGPGDGCFLNIFCGDGGYRPGEVFLTRGAIADEDDIIEGAVLGFKGDVDDGFAVNGK